MNWGLACAVKECDRLAVERVILYPAGRWPEHRHLCGAHAAVVRAWAEREGLDRPVAAWLPGQAARPPCPGCGCRRSLFRRRLCRSCYELRRRAA